MLSKKTFRFLKLVAENNNREWFAENKNLYEEAKVDVLIFVESIIKMLSEVDPLISSEFEPKKALMRIYRDVRFSKNKDPYKKNLGIWISHKSKGGNEPGYYIHLQPGYSFIAGGYWMPEANHLKLIRQEIDYNSDGFLEMINDENFAKHFSLSSANANALKNAPKGYDPADPNIEFLKLKSYEVVKNIDDDEFYDPEIVDKLKSYFQIIYPLVAFLRNALIN